MHNNDFDILFRRFHYSAKVQIAKIDKNAQKLSAFCTTQSSWVFEFSHKLYQAQNLQLCLGTTHATSPYPMNIYQIRYMI